jgi:hypothetical protein
MQRNKSAKRTDPALWEAVKAEVTAGSKGGRAGQWSARKAQMAVRLYKARGGGYVGPKSPDNSLTKWTRQGWRTKSGRPSIETGERYLPSDAIEALTDEEYAETTRAKRRGTRKGAQFVKQPEKIARKVKQFRRNTDEPRPVRVPKYLYHATHLGKVDEIAENGLVPSGGSQFSGGYDSHSRGRVFFSGKTGASYWFNKMEMIAEYSSDFKDTDEVARWAPVVLRIETDGLNADVLFYDDVRGRQDSYSPAFYATEAIEPEGIDIWDGNDWVRIEYAEYYEMSDKAAESAEYEHDDDPEEGWYNSEFNLFAPRGV